MSTTPFVRFVPNLNVHFVHVRNAGNSLAYVLVLYTSYTPGFLKNIDISLVPPITCKLSQHYGASGGYYSLQTEQIYRDFLCLLFHLNLQISSNNASSEL